MSFSTNTKKFEAKWIYYINANKIINRFIKLLNESNRQFALSDSLKRKQMDIFKKKKIVNQIVINEYKKILQVLIKRLVQTRNKWNAEQSNRARISIND